MENDGKKLETTADTFTLVSETVADAKRLIELEGRLIQAKTRRFTFLLRSAIAWSVLGFVALIPAGFFLGMSMLEALKSTTALSASSCYLIVCGIYLAFSGIIAFRIRKLIQRQHGASE